MVTGFREKGECIIGGGISNLVFVEGACAVSNNVAIGFNYGQFKWTSSQYSFDFPSGIIEYRTINERRDFGLSAVVFYPISSQSSVELCTGISADKAYRKDHNYFPPSRSLEVRNTQYYVQPGFVTNTGKLTVAVSARTSLLKYRLTGSAEPSNQPEYVQFNNEVADLNSLTDALPLVVEPCITIRIGPQRFKTQLQAGAQLTTNRVMRNLKDDYFASIGFFATLDATPDQNK
jgi:hypothetical protein